MARMKFSARKDGITTGTSLKTLIQVVAPSNIRVVVLEVGIGFHDTVNTDAPVTVNLMRQSTAGTMSPLTPVKADYSLSETIQSTAQHTATVEPTAADILATWSIHPQTGLVYQQPKNDEFIIPGAGKVGLTVTAGTSTTADAYLKCEE